MGRVVEGEKMKSALEAQHSIPETSRPGTSNVLWRIIEFTIGGIFIYAGIVKAMDPLQFAIDIDNYKILPWGIGMRLAFYLPWLEILCGLALIVRRLYAGALSILLGLMLVFIAGTIAARARGIDISCGCFGHISKNLSFNWHLVLDFSILAALIVFWFANGMRRAPRD